MSLRNALRAFGAVLVLATALPAQSTRLSNVSVRTNAGGADVLITGFTVGPGAAKQVLVRAVGPTLGVFGVDGALADPKLELYNSAAVKIAENDNWNATDTGAFSAVGAFALAANSKDAAIVATLAPGSYTAQITGLGAAGVALVEVYEVGSGSARLVNLSTRAQVGTGANILIPGITVSAGAGTRRLLVRAVGPTLGAFGVDGTLADPKLELFSGTAKIAENDNWGTPVGATAADAATLTAAFAQNGAFALTSGSRDAALLVSLGAGSYTLQVSGVGATTGTALVEVYDLTPENQTGARPSSSLYIAQLRPESAAAGSVASGIATLAVNPDGSASVSVSFTNLTSDQTSAHLQLGASRDYVMNLSLGQVSRALWTFAPAGTFTTNDLVNALNTGNISVGLGSARFPGGELRGNFVAATGSQTFTAPAAPPALAADALTAPSQTDAARFLTQATFGPTLAEIESLRTRGITAWINDQLALPATSLYAGLQADVTTFGYPPSGNQPFIFARPANFNVAWWKIAATAPDQLRQRVAFALSEIFVVGNMGALNVEIAVKAKYYDLLVNGAFGSFRQLLENVTLSPVMGMWLSHLANQKTDPVTGTAPDENYAREVMQLFSIGLVQLQPDGTLLLDSAGLPIPTYDLTTIAETAKVLTGWSYAVAPANTTNVATYRDTRPPRVDVVVPAADNAWFLPMRHFDAFHDKTEKRIVSLQQVPLATAAPTVIPAGRTGPQDLAVLLDTLANHPNTGPFIVRRLIQRLVTSNPSPGYVYRVARVFSNDGTGTRGNLGAVVRAILTDYEARSPDLPANISYGKIKEPILRLSGFVRALNVRAANGRYMDGVDLANSITGNRVGCDAFVRPERTLGQAPLNAATVFNFFSPDYSPPGPIAAAGLVAPELQITDAASAIEVPNQITELMFRNRFPATIALIDPAALLAVDYSALLPLANSPAALVARLNLLFCADQLTAPMRTLFVTTLQNLPASATDLQRVETAVQLVFSSSDAATQR